jgi:hypothetical protein
MTTPQQAKSRLARDPIFKLFMLATAYNFRSIHEPRKLHVEETYVLDREFSRVLLGYAPARGIPRRHAGPAEARLNADTS